MKINFINRSEVRKNLYALIGILFCILPVALVVMFLAPPAEFLTPLDINKALIVWANTVGKVPWLRWFAYATSLIALFIALRRAGALLGRMFFVPHLLLYLATFYFVAVAYSQNQLTGVPWLPTAVDFGYISEVESDPTRQFWIAAAEDPKANSDLNALLRKHGAPSYRHYADAKCLVAFHRHPAPELSSNEWALDTLALMVILHALLIFRHYRPVEKLPVEDEIEDDDKEAVPEIDDALWKEIHRIRSYDILFALSPLVLFIGITELSGKYADISISNWRIFALCVYGVHAWDKVIGKLCNYLYRLQQYRLDAEKTSRTVNWPIAFLRFLLLVVWWPVNKALASHCSMESEDEWNRSSTGSSSSANESTTENYHEQNLNDPSNRC